MYLPHFHFYFIDVLFNETCLIYLSTYTYTINIHNQSYHNSFEHVSVVVANFKLIVCMLYILSKAFRHFTIVY